MNKKIFCLANIVVCLLAPVVLVQAQTVKFYVKNEIPSQVCSPAVRVWCDQESLMKLGTWWPYYPPNDGQEHEMREVSGNGFFSGVYGKWRCYYSRGEYAHGFITNPAYGHPGLNDFFYIEKTSTAVHVDISPYGALSINVE